METPEANYQHDRQVPAYSVSGRNTKRWTAEETATLRRIWTANGTITDIQIALNRTRGSVAGAIRKLGLTRNPSDPNYVENDRLRDRQREDRKRPQNDLLPYERDGQDIDHLHAAAMIAEGATYAQAMLETGLNMSQVANAVRRSRIRELRELASMPPERAATIERAWAARGYGELAA